MYYYAGIYEEGNFPGESFTSAPLDISFSSDGQYLYSLNEVLYSIDVYKVDIERQTLTLHSSVVSLQDSLSLDLANFSSNMVRHDIIIVITLSVVPRFPHTYSIRLAE